MRNAYAFPFLLCAVLVSALSARPLSPYEGKYLRFAGSAGYVHIKDAGASPLRYHGAGMNFSMAFVSEDRDATWGARGDMSLAAGFAASRYMQHSGNLRFDIFYLRQIPRLTGTDRQIQAGASWLSGMGFTYNEAYQNASVNVNLFSGPHVSGRYTHTFRRPACEKKLAFLHLRLPERRYKFLWRLDLPLLLYNRRPPFAYVINGTQVVPDILDGHFFPGGFHFRSKAGLARYLKNGNAVEISYIWDMFTSGRRDLYRFESASHEIQCSFYFKLD